MSSPTFSFQMRIKVLIGCAGDNYAFRKGDEYDTSEEIGKDLVKAGFAIELSAPKQERATATPTEKAKVKGK